MAGAPGASNLETLNPAFDSLNSLAEDIAGSIREIVATSVEEGMYKTTILFFFTKGWRTFRSLHALYSKRLGEDALVLSRSLFEAVVHMLYISKDPLKRAMLFNEYDFIQRKILYEELQKSTDASSKKLLAFATPEGIAELSKEYDRVKNNYPGKKYSWSGLSIKDMAKKVGMEYQYNVVYTLQSRHAHPNPRSIQSYLKSDRAGFELTYESDQVEVQQAWLGGSLYFLMTMDMANSAFQLTFKERIETINKLITQAIPQSSSVSSVPSSNG